MKTLLTSLVILLVAGLGSGTAHAQTDVTVDPAKLNLAFMNVFNLPPPDDDGALQFGSVWGLGDLTASYSGSELTLGPNTIDDPDPFWYIGGGGPGAPGNKIMEANAYAEETGTLSGQTVTFNGMVLSSSLTSAHTVVAFIKDFAPDFSSSEESTVALTGPGTFTVTLDTIDDPARHVQYGFQMTGVNVWATDVGPFGTMTVGPDQPSPTETTTWGRIKRQYR